MIFSSIGSITALSFRVVYDDFFNGNSNLSEESHSERGTREGCNRKTYVIFEFRKFDLCNFDNNIFDLSLSLNRDEEAVRATG